MTVTRVENSIYSLKFPQFFMAADLSEIFISFFSQTHPNVDKKTFQAKSHIVSKVPSKPFPLNQDVGVLRWRFQSQDDSFIPLSSELL